jgi:hypothetical protein
MFTIGPNERQGVLHGWYDRCVRITKVDAKSQSRESFVSGSFMHDVRRKEEKEEKEKARSALFSAF